LKEFRLYLSHLSLRRALNLALCGLGFAFSKVFKFPIVLGLPYSLSIETTNRCNLSCPECPSGIGKLGRPIGDMSITRFNQIVDEVSPFATTILLHFQGEPLLHQNIGTLIAYASSKRLITEMASNATLLSESISNDIVSAGLKKLVITIDSPHKSDFGFYRNGGSLSKVVEGIKNVQSAKLIQRSKYPLIVLELLAFKGNVENIDEFVSLAKSLNADTIRIKSAQIVSGNSGFNNIPLNSRYSRYKLTNNGDYILKGNPNTTCSNPWFKHSVTQDGWIVPCCFDKSAHYVLGSINFESIRTIWHSPIYKLFRSRILAHRNQMPICKECPQGRMTLDFHVR
jgi:radical SAM protein with 4Fe4S-binding SPASM domain